jgi:hypothetical protein
VHELESLDVERLRLKNILRREHALREQPLLEQGILTHREGMAGGHRRLVVRVITTLHPPRVWRVMAYRSNLPVLAAQC